LYRYSLVYLFLLFLAMAIDRQIGPASTSAPSDTMRLTRLTVSK
jgi:hypothetical protein